MFAFTPPATPQTAPTPCPECHSLLALSVYATQCTEYYRCVQCRHVWTLSHSETTADAEQPDTAVVG